MWLRRARPTSPPAWSRSSRALIAAVISSTVIPAPSSRAAAVAGARGGATGGRAKLGVFLDAYKVKLSNTKLSVPQEQVGAGATAQWDVDDGAFVGTPCEGEDAVIKVRVWRDYTTGAFEDKITDFRNLRFTNNGMVFAIAVVPDGDDDFELDQPDSAAKLDELGKADAVYPKLFTELVTQQSPVRSQAGRGVCSIFATNALMEHLYIKAGDLPNPDFSEQFLQWSVKVEGGDFTNTEGSNSNSNLEAITRFGIVRAHDCLAAALTGPREQLRPECASE